MYILDLSNISSFLLAVKIPLVGLQLLGVPVISLLFILKSGVNKYYTFQLPIPENKEEKRPKIMEIDRINNKEEKI